MIVILPRLSVLFPVSFDALIKIGRSLGLPQTDSNPMLDGSATTMKLNPLNSSGLDTMMAQVTDSLGSVSYSLFRVADK